MRRSAKCHRATQITAPMRERLMQSSKKCYVFTVPRPWLGNMFFCNMDQLGFCAKEIHHVYQLGTLGPKGPLGLRLTCYSWNPPEGHLHEGKQRLGLQHVIA